MGYELCAVVGSEKALRAFTIGLDARIVPLAAGMSLVPLTEKLLETLKADSGDDAKTVSPVFEFLYRAIVDRAIAASEEGPLAYVEAGYFGGQGLQMAVAWDQGNMVMEPSDTDNPINQALRLLGVKAAPPDDEFDTIGLGRHRRTARW
ncbi:MAG: hypothetical protein DMG65_12730 [Candidatus Angelobacter sp. Gp1-AA117]|nr:MAG: hypothetical protein DMG65_12730 [Candidatus Angelobacter sp. Gp1-AA117]